MTTATRAAPPSCNTGASETTDWLSWDYYSATLKGLTSVNVVLAALREVAAPEGQWKAVPGLHGYTNGHRLEGVEVGDVVVFHRDDEIHVQASSAVAEVVVSLLRERWPDHTVSRADIAWDVDAPGAFDRLYRRVHHLAKTNPRRPVSTSQRGDWLDRLDGRTFYAGKRGGRMLIRVYEKGHEQLGKDPLCGASKDWTRVEWEVRPSSKEKAWLARASKVEALGLTRFGARVADELLGTEVQAVIPVLRFASQDPLYWMCRQFKRPVRDLLAMDPLDAMRLLADTLERASAGPPP